MPFYSKYELENLAKEAMVDFLSNDIPLNTSIIKLAKANDLNKNQISRVVENVNPQTYQKLFPEAKDKYIEFDTADRDKVSQAVLGMSAGYAPVVDELADYRLSPKQAEFNPEDKIENEKIENEKVASSSVDPHARDINPDDLTVAQANKVSQVVKSAEAYVNGKLSEIDLKFTLEKRKFKDMVKQAILDNHDNHENHENHNNQFGLVKEASIRSQNSKMGMHVINTVFDEFKDTLIKEGVTKYPYLVNLSDSVGTPKEININHPLVKKAQELVEISQEFIDLKEKKAGLVRKAGAAALKYGVPALGGVVLGSVGTAAIMQKKQDKQKAKDALYNSPMAPRNLDRGLHAMETRY